MKGKVLLLIATTALTLLILTTSYAYWTDHLSIVGEAGFEFRLPVINDITIEDQSHDEAPDDIKRSESLPDKTTAATEKDSEKQGTIPEAPEEQVVDESTEFQ